MRHTWSLRTVFSVVRVAEPFFSGGCLRFPLYVGCHHSLVSSTFMESLVYDKSGTLSEQWHSGVSVVKNNQKHEHSSAFRKKNTFGNSIPRSYLYNVKKKSAATPVEQEWPIHIRRQSHFTYWAFPILFCCRPEPPAMLADDLTFYRASRLS